MLPAHTTTAPDGTHGPTLPRAEHVFVTDLPEPAPSLLLGWRRRRDGGWEGWCAIAHPADSGPGLTSSMRWVRAESIRPA